MDNTSGLLDKYDIGDIYKKLRDIPKMNYEEKVSTILFMLKLPIASIRNTAQHIGSTILGNETLVDMLRNDEDDVMRNTAMEIIKNKGEKGYQLALELLKDSDKDVVLSAVLIVDHFRDIRSIDHLTNLLESTDDPNIIQAVLLALGNTGDIRVLDTLTKFLDKDIWLQIASITALGELRNPVVIKFLKGFLNDPMLSSFALESLSKINSLSSFNIIFDYWLNNRENLDTEHILGHLCNIAENKKIRVKESYFNEIKKLIYADNVSPSIKNLSVRIALSTGISEDIGTLLEILLLNTNDDIFPPCLKSRFDVVGDLISINKLLAIKWATMLCRMNLKKLNDDLVSNIIKSVITLVENNDFDEQLINLLIELLKKYKSNNIAGDLLDLYLKMPFIERMVLNNILIKYKMVLPEIIKKKQIIDKKTSIILDIILENINENTFKEFFALQLHRMKAILPYIFLNRKFLDGIPIDEMIDHEKEEAIQFLAVVSDKFKINKYLPIIRECFNCCENPDLIKVLGDLKDEGSVKRLIELLNSENPLIKSLAIESLGKIGNKEAKKKLMEVACSSDNKISRIAYMALKNCVEKDDINFFREALFNDDWYIRYIAIDALIKISDADIDKYLFQLISDPNKSVSEKAKSILENKGIKK